jgi:cobalt-zinc-cadmium efflux system membrane fusion protein
MVSEFSIGEPDSLIRKRLIMKKIVMAAWLMAACVPLKAEDLKITLTAQQIQNLGVQIGRLQSVVQTPLLTAPAQVVIPPAHEQIVSASLSGLISKLYVAAGDPVQKGAPLAIINSPELLSLQRQFLKAANERNLALSMFQRDKKLHEEGVIAERRWQESRSDYQTFSAELNETRQLLEIAGMSVADINKLASKRHLDSQLTLYAPVDGVVMERYVVVGERLDRLAPLYRIANLDELWLEINAPQEQAGLIRVGDQVRIENTDVTATVSLLGRHVEHNNQTVMVRAVIDQADKSLRAGQNLNVQIIQNVESSAFVVPNSAIAQSEGQAYIFVRTKEGFNLYPVTIIGKQDQTSVIAGSTHLTPDMDIATQGAVALKANWLGLGGDE